MRMCLYEKGNILKSNLYPYAVVVTSTNGDENGETFVGVVLVDREWGPGHSDTFDKGPEWELSTLAEAANLENDASTAEEKKKLIYELEMVFGECAYEPSERGAGIAFTEDIEEKVMRVFDGFQIAQIGRKD